MHLRFFLLTILIIANFLFLSYSQTENSPWEKLGLSQTEWRLINENNIPMSKVEQLLKNGISIGEYLQKPWEPLKMSEEKWIKKRHSGMTSYDIEQEYQHVDIDKNWKDGMNTDAGQTVNQISKNSEQFSSLFLPGYYQMKTNQTVKGSIMISLAAGALTWCTFGSIVNKRFEVLPIVLILIPDMVWSFTDYKIKKHYEQKQN